MDELALIPRLQYVTMDRCRVHREVLLILQGPEHKEGETFKKLRRIELNQCKGIGPRELVAFKEEGYGFKVRYKQGK
jgi:hypothetical protein